MLVRLHGHGAVARPRVSFSRFGLALRWLSLKGISLGRGAIRSPATRFIFLANKSRKGSMDGRNYWLIGLLFILAFVWVRAEAATVWNVEQKALLAPFQRASTEESEDGRCVWFDECHTKEPGGTKQNCVYNGTSQTLHDKEALRILRDICPDLVRGKIHF